ncbi:meckelin isoform X2 [Cimex lectularius]|uniref:Meckelin n=1 Tax=Cimex lectularius TaxID=79782 RepID=A0A8I6RZ19_CIMLE|nr:meckelin isoform X2 [Cimex lectularius]
MLILILLYFNRCFSEIVKRDPPDLFNGSDKSCASNEYFNIKNLRCSTCDPSKNLTVSALHDSCVCNNRSIFNGWDPNGYRLCLRCKDNEIPSLDKSFCIGLPNNSSPNTICGDNNIIVDRYANGTKMKAINCIRCVSGTVPNQDRSKCIKCSYPFENCLCPIETHIILPSNECIPSKKLPDWTKVTEMFEIEYEESKRESKLMRYKLHSAYYWCQMKQFQSCQLLSNLCVLTMYQELTGPCRLLKDIKTSKYNVPLPWIAYNEKDVQNIFNEDKIKKKFRLVKDSEDSYVQIVFSKWSLNGTWQGFVNGMKVLAVCKEMEFLTDLRFTVDYENKCAVSPQDFLSERTTEFYDIYLKYRLSNETYIYPIPILNLNYKIGNKFPNKYGDKSQWQLTHRMFVFENPNDFNIEAKTNIAPTTIRYLKSAALSIRVKKGPEEGLINTPLLILSYGEFNKEDVQNNRKKTFSFKVQFSMKSNVKRNMDIGLGILCSASVIWSLIRAWAYTRRSGQRPIDLIAVLHVCIIACGHLANVFFFVISITALHAFVYYKWQAVAHVLLPSARLQYLVRTYVIVSFPLKAFEIFVLIWHHVTVDIFLIDWEQPRAQKQTIFDVSAWRTYFVANKWGEIQTVRKTSVLLQLCLVVFVLKVCGLEHWSLNIPELHTSPNHEAKHASEDRVFRFALSVVVYVGVYLIQWILFSGIYERYIKNSIQEFVDICSLANISLFVLALENYGFYVHGRSAHGFSDTDMATLRKQLRREEEDLVRHRGLVPESDHQTFQILIPTKLRGIYKSLLTNLPHELSRFNITNLKKGNKSVSGSGDHTMQAYVTVNRFLAAFIEHALKDLDYEVRDRLFIEALLDIELHDSKVKGIFFNDNGHSFDNVLYYGNELSLFTFNLIFFCFVEIIAQNYLLAAILTGLCDEAIARIRKYCSRKNFAKKALIDENFLL